MLKHLENNNYIVLAKLRDPITGLVIESIQIGLLYFNRPKALVMCRSLHQPIHLQ